MLTGRHLVGPIGDCCASRQITPVQSNKRPPSCRPGIRVSTRSHDPPNRKIRTPPRAAPDTRPSADNPSVGRRHHPPPTASRPSSSPATHHVPVGRRQHGGHDPKRHRAMPIIKGPPLLSRKRPWGQAFHSGTRERDVTRPNQCGTTRVSRVTGRRHAPRRFEHSAHGSPLRAPRSEPDLSS